MRERWIGIPYADPGVPGDGLCCLSLVLAWWREVGGVDIPDPQVTLEASEPPAEWWTHWSRVPLDDRRVGTVLVKRGEPRHVGVVYPARDAAKILTTTVGGRSLLVPLRAFDGPHLLGAWRPAAAP